MSRAISSARRAASEGLLLAGLLALPASAGVAPIGRLRLARLPALDAALDAAVAAVSPAATPLLACRGTTPCS